MSGPVDLIQSVESGVDLSREAMDDVMEQWIAGRWEDEAIARFLRAMAAKGETAEELTGAAQVLRRHMTPIRHRHPWVLDTCGTGGDGTSTFNISTASALVVAAAGVPVAKHGNRSVSSSSGSADVLRILGVNVDADLATVERCLDEIGICFCFAPLWHGSVRGVAEIRRRLGIPTLFNWIGPLCNPAGASHQVLGVGRERLRSPMAEALHALGTDRAVVVHGRDGLDEVTLGDRTDLMWLEGGSIQARSIDPESFGMSRIPWRELQTASAAASAATIDGVLKGQIGPAREIVVANAALAVWLARRETELSAAVLLARRLLDDGTALGTLRRLCEISQGT